MLNLNSILVPVDFSACSRRALELAHELGPAARLDVLHVTDIPQFIPQSAALLGVTETQVMTPAVVTAAPETSAQRIGEVVRGRADEALQKFVAEVQASGIPVASARVALGVPSEVIVSTLQGGGYDMIVLGTHGRQGIAKWLLGNVAEKVVRLSPVPVLTVRVADD